MVQAGASGNYIDLDIGNEKVNASIPLSSTISTVG